LELEVADDGRGPPTDVDPRIGRGLIGMRERAALHNGAVRAGAGKNGGYLVRASLSLAEGVP
jgi:signal transduction histidine kinase